jgi:hypothetical protein
LSLHQINPDLDGVQHIIPQNFPSNSIEATVGHTPRVPQGRMKMDSYKNSPVILLGLVPCNPTRTRAM